MHSIFPTSNILWFSFLCYPFNVRSLLLVMCDRDYDDDSNDEIAKDNEGKEMTNDNNKSLFAMDYDKYRDDQMNTGVIAALLGGFALTNSWEMELRPNSAVDSVMYVLAILAVHACTCSALTSAFLYRALTCNDPKLAVLWMRKHPFLAKLPYTKFVVGTLAYIVSVILIAWKELSEEYVARIITLVIGVMSACVAALTIGFVHFDHGLTTKCSGITHD